MRRIPPGCPWIEPPDRITSCNFKLRKGESGISVYRKSVVREHEVLAHARAIPGSLVVKATTADIRSLRSASGDLLHLDVVAVDDEADPGHAEIRGPNPGRLSKAASRAIARLFRPTPGTHPSAQ